VVVDRSDHESEEPDPEADFQDPDSDSLTIPRVETEDAGSGLRADLRSELEAEGIETIEPPEVSPDISDVPSDLAKAFWVLVLVVNAAVLMLSLGLMFLLFNGDTARGVPLTGGGLLLVGFAWRRYRQFDSVSDSTDTDEPTDGTDSQQTEYGADERG